MVRFKNRYIACEIKLVGKKNKKFDINSEKLSKEIKNQVQRLHGDFGAAAIRPAFHIHYCNQFTGLALVRVRHGPHRFITSSLPFITSINMKQVTVHILYIGATIKQCFKFFIKHQKDSLISAWSILHTIEEKEAFRKALISMPFETVTAKFT